jgi:undecaprenyl-diphosphatase
MLAQGDPYETAGEVTLLAAVVYGMVEGLTEFLPVSSTGHLIVAGHVMQCHNDTLEIGIQSGAISAILVLYWRDLWQGVRTLREAASGRSNLLLQIVLAALPAAVLGMLVRRPLKEHLFTPMVVAIATIAGALGLLVLEAWLARRPGRTQRPLWELGYRSALCIGLWQCLALVPGTSRSAATIAGALLVGLSRPAAAEFSFLVGLPILYGACAVELSRNWQAVSGPVLVPFLVATLIAFLSALVVVRPFVGFLRKYTFRPFAYYRLGFGVLLLGLCVAGVLRPQAGLR